MRNKATTFILNSTAIISTIISTIIFAVIITTVISVPGSLTAAAVPGSLENKSKSSQYWWQAELRITVTGEYSYKSHSKNKNFDGKYAFTAVILGSMEEDDQDYIFLQAYQAIQQIRWSEVMQNANSRKAVNRSKELVPDPTLNYVFQKNDKLSFDFDFRRVPVPGKTQVFPKSVKKLRLPESAGNSSVKTKTLYNNGVVEGSNRLVLPKKEIYSQKETTRTFRWKWKEHLIETDPQSSAKPLKSWFNRHTVEAKLKIIRLPKKNREQTARLSSPTTRK